MHALLRHIAVRLWATAIFGSLMSLWLLPRFQGQFGLNWLVVGLLVVFVLCYLLIGHLFRQLGNRRISSLVLDAAGFERDGLSDEALACYRRAMASLDSFLLSPGRRRRLAEPLARRLARFHIARADEDAMRSFIPAYLADYPQDADVAEYWLKQIEQRGGLKEEHQDLAAQISSAHPDNCDIQRVLANFFLFLERTDYPALAAYRCVWDEQPPPGPEFKKELARLFLRDRRVDEWSLEAYLALLGDDPPGAGMIEALAACVHLIPDSPAAHMDLVEARRVLGDLTAEEIEALCDEFRPLPAAKYHRRSGAQGGLGLRSFLKSLAGQIAGIASAAGVLIERFVAAVKLIRSSARARRAAAVVSLGIVVAAVGLFAWSTLRHLTKPQPPPAAETVQPPPVEAADPFTLQVAAYLSLDYAKKYVADLKRQGFDAYWSTAVSGQKKWYQVRISHFATKQEALQLGESLKTRGLIDDFYVANYTGAKPE